MLFNKNTDWTIENDGIITNKNQIYIPPDHDLWNEIIEEHHDTTISGHPGCYKTNELITRNYWWPRIQADINKYVNACEPCQRTKVQRNKPHTPLHPHAIPQHPWEHISADLIGPLPMTDQNHDGILVIVDRFTKMNILIPINMEFSTMQLAENFQDHVWSKHGLPQKVISDRGPQFVSQFMKDLYLLIDIKGNPSTAYHPQTDGQTERMNQEIEQYLRLFTNYQQTDWDQWLSLAEFAYNNQKSAATNYSPFYLNYGRHPVTGTEIKKEVRSQSAVEFAEWMKIVHEDTEASLAIAAEQMKFYHDKGTTEPRDYRPNDLVWLEGHNIPTDCPSKKLDDKRYRPFPIIEKIGASAYKLKLPKTWRKLYPVINEWFLTPYVKPIKKTKECPLPELVEGAPEYEVEEVMDSKVYRGRIRYLVRWTGYPERHEWTWEPIGNLRNAEDKVSEFHRLHSAAPRPADTAQLHFISIPEINRNQTQDPKWINGKL